VPFGSAALAVAVADKFGSIVKRPKPALWVATHPSNVTMTQLAFICFKIRNRLHDFILSPDEVDPATIGRDHELGIALMKSTLIAEATALWGGGDWPAVGVNIVRKD
jgi:hypothetical protein